MNYDIILLVEQAKPIVIVSSLSLQINTSTEQSKIRKISNVLFILENFSLHYIFHNLDHFDE